MTTTLCKETIQRFTGLAVSDIINIVFDGSVCYKVGSGLGCLIGSFGTCNEYWVEYATKFMYVSAIKCSFN